jgi:predicted acyltransferase
LTIAPAGRLRALDVLRGASIAGMIVVNNAGLALPAVYPALQHARWNGWTLADLVFPFFLFVMGAGMAYSVARGLDRARIARRCALLFALGLVVNGFPDFDLTQLRLLGVLQRIALTYLLATLVVFLLPRWAPWVVATGCLVGYWLLMTYVPVPGHGAGVLTPRGNLAAWIDRGLIGERHLYRGGADGYDPEGLLSTVPALATVLLGYATARFVRREPPSWTRVLVLVNGGLILVALGWLWGRSFPVNKRLWTSSYTLLTGGLALLALAACLALVDLGRAARRERAASAWPWEVLGRNAIVAYVGSELLASALQHIDVHVAGGRVIDAQRWVFERWFVSWAGALRGSLAFAVAFMLVFWVTAAVLHRFRVTITV